MIVFSEYHTYYHVLKNRSRASIVQSLNDKINKVGGRDNRKAVTLSSIHTAAVNFARTEWPKYYGPETHNGFVVSWPWHFKYLTVNHIYYPLAQSSGKIFELLKAHKGHGGDRAKKLLQFLNEIGARAPGRHLGRGLEMAESSADKFEYKADAAR